ncbi:hypothetical protein BC629DRAFT_505756 [Irpex lacteus]|nr:hypothetical protein BC629DRAFT_505756 [Irpex lacteus]
MPAAAQRFLAGFFGQEQLCRVLHILLIFLYVALVAIASQHYEHGLNSPFTPAGQATMSVTASTISQTFSTLYLAALVLVTQRVALIHDLNTRQTLTAIHDKTSAWLGLGSSLLALIDQFKLPSAVPSVICTGIYLAGIAALHITIPASVSINTYNATVFTQQTTQLARPAFSLIGYREPVSLDILGVYNQFQQLGLLDNMLYDILPTVPMAVNDATVNATIFHVGCKGIPNGRHDKGAYYLDDRLSSKFPTANLTEDTWAFLANFTELQVEGRFQIPLLAPSTLTTKGVTIYTSNIKNTYSTGEPEILRNAIQVVSTIPVLHASQDTDGLLSLNPGIAWSKAFSTPPNSNVSLSNNDVLVNSVQVILCNVFPINTTVQVSASTRQPIDNSVASTAPVWKDWAYQLDPTIAQDPVLDYLSQAFRVGPDATHTIIRQNTMLGGPYDTNTSKFEINGKDRVFIAAGTYSMIDQFLMEDLNLGIGTADPPSHVTLTDLQRSLGKAVAAIVWYDRNKNHSSVFSNVNSISPLDPPVNENRTGEATVEVSVIRLRLNFNVVPVSTLFFYLPRGYLLTP